MQSFVTFKHILVHVALQTHSLCDIDWAEFNDECLYFGRSGRRWLDAEVIISYGISFHILHDMLGFAPLYFGCCERRWLDAEVFIFYEILCRILYDISGLAPVYFGCSRGRWLDAEAIFSYASFVSYFVRYVRAWPSVLWPLWRRWLDAQVIFEPRHTKRIIRVALTNWEMQYIFSQYKSTRVCMKMLWKMWLDVEIFIFYAIFISYFIRYIKACSCVLRLL